MKDYLHAFRNGLPRFVVFIMCEDEEDGSDDMASVRECETRED
jgi:hypothetical protein